MKSVGEIYKINVSKFFFHLNFFLQFQFNLHNFSQTDHQQSTHSRLAGATDASHQSHWDSETGKRVQCHCPTHSATQGWWPTPGWELSHGRQCVSFCIWFTLSAIIFWVKTSASVCLSLCLSVYICVYNHWNYLKIITKSIYLVNDHLICGLLGMIALYDRSLKYRSTTCDSWDLSLIAGTADREVKRWAIGLTWASTLIWLQPEGYWWTKVVVD